MTSRKQGEITRLKPHLIRRARDLAIRLYGKDFTETSTELRFGGKGGLSVTIAGPFAGRFKDFSEDGEHGDLLDLISYRTKCTQAEAISYAKKFLGIEDGKVLPEVDQEALAAEQQRRAEEHHRAQLFVARKIWDASSAELTDSVRRYLLSRSIDPDNLPPSVRCRVYGPEEFEHTKKRKNVLHGLYDKFPKGIHSLVFASTNLSGEIRAIQEIRIYDGMKVDRHPESAPHWPAQAPVKKSMGVVKGSAVRFGRSRDFAVVVEGPETGLSAYQAGGYMTFVTLGTSNFTSFEPPAALAEMVIASEREESGSGLSAAIEAAVHWNLLSKRCGIAVVDPHQADLHGIGDLNDVHQRLGGDAVVDVIDKAQFADIAIPDAVSTAVFVENPDSALAFWASTGAFVRALPRGLTSSKATLPDSVRRIVVVKEEGSKLDFDDIKKFREIWSRVGIDDLRSCHLDPDTALTARASFGDAAMRYVLRNASPITQRIPMGLASLSAYPDDAAVVLADRVETLEIARAIFPDNPCVAAATRDPKKTDWSMLAGRRVVIAPVHNQRGQTRAAFLVMALAAAKAEPALITWPIIAPQGDRYVRLRSSPPEGFDLSRLQYDGWSARTAPQLLQGARRTAVLE